jgi:hypothetical protein
MAVQIVGGIRMTSVAITLAEWAAGITGFGSFTHEAVRRDAARRLAGLVETKLEPGGSGLLDGELEAEVHTADGTVRRARQKFPPGSPARPPTAAQLAAKLAACVCGLDTDPASWSWDSAAEILRRFVPAAPGEGSRHG